MESTESSTRSDSPNKKKKGEITDEGQNIETMFDSTTEPMSLEKFRTAYGKPIRVRKAFSEESRTKQAFADECDINQIMARYEKTGVVDHVKLSGAHYGDFPQISYHESLNAVIAAQEAFMALPARIRAKFGNDPGAFVDFATDPDNADEMRKMGLHTQTQNEAESHSALTTETPESHGSQSPAPPVALETEAESGKEGS